MLISTGFAAACVTVITSLRSPLLTMILPSRDFISKLGATANCMLVSTRPRVATFGSIGVIHEAAASSTVHSKVIFALMTISISPPFSSTSNVELVVVSASFCFCITLNSTFFVPQRRAITASLSSGVSFGSVVTLRVTLPALPESGSTEHQEPARVSFTVTVQSAVAVNDTLSVPPCEEKTGAGVSVCGKLIS